MKKFILVIFVFMFSCPVFSQPVWQQFYGGTSEVSVYALAMYQGDLVVAGFFDTIGTLPVHNIGRWNGSSWSTLGNGFAGTFFGYGVRCLAVYNGDLIAGGYFDSAGTVYSKGVARWNGSNWISMGGGVGGLNPHVEALYVFQGQLYAGGTFTSAGGTAAVGIARWNGTDWSPVGAPIFPPSVAQYFGVYGLIQYNSHLYLGGTFEIFTGDGSSADSSVISMWDGTYWQPVGGGICGNIVKAFTVYNNRLTVGGEFYQAGDVPVGNIAQWDGTNWTKFADGTDGAVYSFCVIGNNLYTGGTFTTTGGIQTSMISKWDGDSWTPLTTGTDAGIVSIINYPPFPSTSNIVVGGFFTHAGGYVARHLATWGDFTGFGQLNNQAPRNYSLSQNYPNPFNPGTKIKFSVPVQGFVTLTVYNEQGQEIERLVERTMNPGNYEVNFEAKNLSSGAYFYKLQAGNFVETKKMMLVK